MVELYSSGRQAEWDAFVASSTNGTFLFMRDYMDYHADRFTDGSLMISSGGDIAALLPANRDAATLRSHGGLTYGGFVIGEGMKAPQFLEMFETVRQYLRGTGFTALDYRPVPSIYHRQPADYDLHAVFQGGAQVTRSTLMSVVIPRSAPPLQERRRRQIRKAEREGLAVAESADIAGYWAMLSERLSEGHDAKPVHSLEEITNLQRRFPDNIRLFACMRGDEMLAGVLVYESERVARTQYIAGSEAGRSLGAVDLVLHHLIANVYSTKDFVDLGTSEDGGSINRGLIDQKEGFGARGVALLRIELPISEAGQ